MSLNKVSDDITKETRNMLNKCKGNQYDWITHTWNPVKGACPHGCSYCYMDKIYKRFGIKAKPPHLAKSELRVNLGSGNTIFVCSSIDLFAEDIPLQWINKVVSHAKTYPNNTYLWHTKNPKRAVELLPILNNFILCVTAETDLINTRGLYPQPLERIKSLKTYNGRKMLTIEPIMDFNLDVFLREIIMCNVEQVNIGADSGNNHLPEPSKEKLLEFISELEKFTKVVKKKNLGRIIA